MEKRITSMRGLMKGFTDAMAVMESDRDYDLKQVAYLSYQVANETGCSEEEKLELIYAALLHDVGPSLYGDSPKMGFIRDISNAFAKPVAELPSMGGLSKADLFGQIIKLSVKVSQLADPKKAALNQVEDICESIAELADVEIHPKAVEAFLSAAKRESLWMEFLYQPERCLDYIPDSIDVTIDETIELSRIMSRIIDYRSSYTAMHSACVADTAVRLAEIIGMSEDECKMIRIAGYLHDIGKVRVPKDILEKSDSLSEEEFNIVKEHAYFTYVLLKEIPGFEQIGSWAGLHHEKLNGYGYPFGLKADDIPMGARILAVADIFSAVTETRPYRTGMSVEKGLELLKENVDSAALSGYIVDILLMNYADIDRVRDMTARTEGARYYATIIGDED